MMTMMMMMMMLPRSRSHWKRIGRGGEKEEGCGDTDPASTDRGIDRCPLPTDLNRHAGRALILFFTLSS